MLETNDVRKVILRCLLLLVVALRVATCSYSQNADCDNDGFPNVAESDTDADGVPDDCDNCTLVVNSGQEDTNGDGIGNRCDADFDQDGSIGVFDFAVFRTAFGRSRGDEKYNEDADLDSDGTVGVFDFQRFRTMFGLTPGPSRTITVSATTSQETFAPGQLVDVELEISSEMVVSFSGIVRIRVFDESSVPGQNVYEAREPLLLASGEFKQVTIQIPQRSVGQYNILAEVITDHGDRRADVVTPFGVRGGFPQVATEILSVQVEELDVPNLRERINTAAATGQPVLVSVGQSRFLVRDLLLIPTDEGGLDEPLPSELQGVQTFEGSFGGPEEENIAVLTLGPSAEEDQEGDDFYAMFLTQGLVDPDDPENDIPQEAFFVEPANIDGDREASSQQHIFYRSTNVRLAPLLHEPMIHPDDQNGAPIAQVVDRPAPKGHTVNKTVRCKIYEHKVSARRTRRRCNGFYCWRAIVKKEFKNIQPRESNAHRLTVDQISIASWNSISTTGYGNDCDSNLAKFRKDHDSVNNRLYILFTGMGSTDCGGIAYLGSGTRTRWHSLTIDKPGSTSVHRLVVVLGQEVGHNWDWHNNWDTSKNSPHDPHCTTNRISERWNHKHGWWIFSWNHRHCTIMNGSYNNCKHVEYKYLRNSSSSITPLRHLAEGIWRYH